MASMMIPGSSIRNPDPILDFSYSTFPTNPNLDFNYFIIHIEKIGIAFIY
jgi:hypothetical protein